MRKVSTVLGIILLAAGASSVAMAAAVAPEIDPASAGSAIALVSGMVLLFRARRAK